ncbi:MAG: CbiQ family ECF transporter T component [Opitutaceae bacterium]
MNRSAEPPGGRWPPKVTVPGSLALIVAITLTPGTRPVWFAAEAALLLAGMALARVSAAAVARRLLILSPFVAGAAFAAAFGAGGTDWRILALRSGLCLVTVILLSQTTSFSELLGFFRAAHVPSLLITTLALMHRYIFVLAEESARMGRARASRTFNRSRPFAWVAAASVVGQLFIRASERAERVYDAMCARGWKP